MNKENPLEKMNIDDPLLKRYKVCQCPGIGCGRWGITESVERYVCVYCMRKTKFLNKNKIGLALKMRGTNCQYFARELVKTLNMLLRK